MSSTDPRSGLIYGWGAGFQGWDAEMDANLLLLGQAGFHLSVKDRDLTAPPGRRGLGRHLHRRRNRDRRLGRPRRGDRRVQRDRLHLLYPAHRLGRLYRGRGEARRPMPVAPGPRASRCERNDRTLIRGAHALPFHSNSF